MMRRYTVSIVVLASLIAGCVATTEPSTRRDPWYQAVVEPMQDDNTRALRRPSDRSAVVRSKPKRRQPGGHGCGIATA